MLLQQLMRILANRPRRGWLLSWIGAKFGQRAFVVQMCGAGRIGKLGFAKPAKQKGACWRSN